MVECSIEQRVKDRTTAREMFHDFLDLYVKSPSKAKSKYPGQARFLENEYKQKFPENAKDIEEATRSYDEWKNSSPVNQIKSQIYFEKPRTWKDWANEKLEKFGLGSLFQVRKSFIDKLEGIRKFSLEGYERARLYAGNMSAINFYMEEGRFKFGDQNRKVIGKSFNDIQKPILDIHEDASAYLVARTREEDLRKSGKIDTDLYRQQKSAIEQLEKQHPQLKEYGKEMKDFYRDTLDYYNDAGMLIPEAYKALKEREQYAPIHRLVENSMANSGIPLSQSLSPKEAIKRRTNVESDYTILDPIITSQQNAAYMISVAERNHIMQGVKQDMAGTAEMFDRVQSKKLSREELNEKIKSFDLNPEFFKDLPPEFVESLIENPIARTDNVINVFEKGVKESYEVDPILYEGIKDIKSDKLPGIFKLLSVPAQGLRTGVTMTPAYIIKAFVRDIPHALVQSQYGVTLSDVFKGLASAWKKDEWYGQFVASGAAYSTASSMSRQAIYENINHLKKAKDSGLLKRWVVDNKLGFEKIREWSEAFEHAPRIAEFRKGIESGATRQKAALAARDITLDFQRKGATMQIINQIVPFSNAFIQGNAQFARMFVPKLVDGKISVSETAKPWIRTMAYIGIPALMNAAYNAGNPKYNNLPEWERNTFFHIDTSPFYDTEEEKKRAPFIRIPKVQELGMWVGNGIEAMTRWAHGKDPKWVDNYLKNNVGSLVEERLLIPTAVMPFIEKFANKSIFYGTPIVPYDREDLLPQAQYNDRNTELFKSISNKLADVFGDTFSPAIAENYVDRWTGSIGRDLLNLTDVALQKSGVLQEVYLPDKDLVDYPLLKTFSTRYPSANAQPIREFFDNYKDADQIKKTVNKLMKEGKREEATKLYKNYQKVKDDKTYKAVTKALQFIKMLKKNDEMDPKRKKILIDQVTIQLIDMTSATNEKINKLQNT